MKNIYALSILAVVATLTLSGCVDEQETLQEYITCQGTSLKADCIVTSFTTHKGPYISRKQQQICMSEPVIEISANEPQGKVQYSLAGDAFLSSAPDMTFTPTMAKLLLTTMQLAGQGWSLIENSTETAKMFGIEYKVLKITGPQGLPGIISSQNVPWAEITLYGNMQKKVVERVTVKNTLSGEELTSYAYNWRFVEEAKKKMPTKIDVLNTDNGTINAKKILQIHYLSFKAGNL